MSIPMAHREYEKILRQLEAECRTHIKCEQQMKLHIECLQEKLDQLNKDIESNKKEAEELETNTKAVHAKEITELNKVLKQLEREVITKVEKLKMSEKARESL